jgi:hypothetical protein
MTLAQIAAELRRLYPAAVSVKIFVNHTEHSIDVLSVDVSGPETGASYRTLDGSWAHGGLPAAPGLAE